MEKALNDLFYSELLVELNLREQTFHLVLFLIREILYYVLLDTHRTGEVIEMGLFNHKKNDSPSAPSPSSTLPIATYHITQSLSGILTVTPTSSNANEHHNTYTILLTRPEKTRHDSIDICVRRQNDGTTVGHCLVQVTTGKFLNATTLCEGGGSEGIQLKHSGHGSEAKYSLSVPSVERRGGELMWVHDGGSLHGAVVNADRRFRLEQNGGEHADSSKPKVLARFAGSSGGVSEFGMLEVYSSSFGPSGGTRRAQGVDWCGLLVLTAVSVYAREERYREKKGKAKGRLEGVGIVGDLLGIAGGI